MKVAAMEAPESADVGPPAPTTMGSRWARTGWGRTVLVAVGVLVVCEIVALAGGNSSALNLVALLSFIVSVFTLWFGALIEALRAPDWLWARASQSKPLFVVLIVLLVVLGSALYLSIARPALCRATQGAPHRN